MPRSFPWYQWHCLQPMEHCLADPAKVRALMDLLEKLPVDAHEDRGANESLSCRCHGGGSMPGQTLMG